MKFYHVKNNFIAYLRQFDSKVSENKNESRPYVGIVLQIENIKYYAPFSSPKSKHRNMKNGKDFRKINNGIYGAINFNNMIPVLESEIFIIEIDKIEDKKYKKLLLEQLQWCLDNSKKIKKHAEKLRERSLKNKLPNRIKSRCCDFSLLEEQLEKYLKKDSL